MSKGGNVGRFEGGRDLRRHLADQACLLRLTQVSDVGVSCALGLQCSLLKSSIYTW